METTDYDHDQFLADEEARQEMEAEFAMNWVMGGGDPADG